MKIFPILAVLMLFSCATHQTFQENSPKEVLRAVEARNMESLYDSDPINAKANIVLIAPGGPRFQSPPSNDHIKNNAYARVFVKQEQMLRKLPTDRFINDAEAGEINLYSAAILYALAKSFHEKGHRVILYSISFGSFIVPRMLQHYGDEPFAKIFITVGRLDMPMAVVNGFANGQFKKFQNGTTVIDKPVNLNDEISQAKAIPDLCNLPNRSTLPDNLEEAAKIAKAICTGNSVDDQKTTALKFRHRSRMTLMANSGRNRYTRLLNGKDLSKITYYFGGKDQAVGRLTNDEVQFLTGRAGFDIDSPPTTTSWYSAYSFQEADRRGGPNFTMNVVKGTQKHASVKYDLDAGHTHLEGEIQKDIVASF